jgi:hypothetical protein
LAHRLEEEDHDDTYCFNAVKTIFDQAMPELKHRPLKNIELFKLMYSDGELNPSDCIDALRDIQVCTPSSTPTGTACVHVANASPFAEQVTTCIRCDWRYVGLMPYHHSLPHSGSRAPTKQTPRLSRPVQPPHQKSLQILSRDQLCDYRQVIHQGNRGDLRQHLCS